MPTWLKITLAVLVTGFVLLVAAGMFAKNLIEKGMHEVDLARAEGEGWGETGSLGVCVQEGVRRTGACTSNKVQCVFEIDAFLWGCLESAPYESEFCAEVPEAGDDPATRKWTLATCARHGMSDDDHCAFNLSMVAAFCSSRG